MYFKNSSLRFIKTVTLLSKKLSSSLNHIRSRNLNNIWHSAAQVSRLVIKYFCVKLSTALDRYEKSNTNVQKAIGDHILHPYRIEPGKRHRRQSVPRVQKTTSTDHQPLSNSIFINPGPAANFPMTISHCYQERNKHKYLKFIFESKAICLKPDSIERKNSASV